MFSCSFSNQFSNDCCEQWSFSRFSFSGALGGFHVDCGPGVAQADEWIIRWRRRRHIT
jgi:hypothetical protein